MTQKLGRPSTSRTDANIEKVHQLFCSDCHITICIMADKLEIAKEMVKKLGMQKVCVKKVT